MDEAPIAVHREFHGMSKLASVLGKRSKVEPSGETDLLEHFGLSNLYNRAVNLAPQRYLSRFPGDARLYSGDKWKLEALPDWESRSAHFELFSRAQFQAAFMLDRAVPELPEEEKGVPVSDRANGGVQDSLARKERKEKKKDKKDRREKKDKKDKKEKKHGRSKSREPQEKSLS